MTRKIMIDMKLNGSRPTKIPLKEKQIPSQPIEIPVHKEEPIKEPIVLKVPEQTKSFSEDESLRRAAVFTNGWQAPVSVKVESNEQKIFANPSNNKDQQKRLYQTPRTKKKVRLLGKPLLAIFLIVLILGGGYFGAMFFERTTITLKEKQQDLALDHTRFTASKIPQLPLHFEIMIVSDTDSKNMVLTESQDVSVSAKGTVMLFNEFSTKPQAISAHSFLADENGKTYKTDNAVTIPGYKMNGTKIVPGQASVGITAFLPGDAYNGKPTDFTISAFKGTTKFKKIYGKATSALSGGAQGLVYVLGSEQRGNLNATALSTFKSRLLKKVNAEVPKGYILYPDALSFSYNLDDNVSSKTPDASVNIDSTLSAIILKESDLESVVSKSILPDISDSERKEVEILDIPKLSFAFADPEQSITKDLQSVSFSLTGDVNAIWHPDVGLLRSQILGVSKLNLPAIFKADPGIAEARATLFPPWQKYLPKDLSKIHINKE